MILLALVRASPSNTMKRHGVSLPWSGTREATVSSVSISEAVGPGRVNSIGFTERRVLSRSRASGMRFPCKFGVTIGRRHTGAIPKRLEFASISVENATMRGLDLRPLRHISLLLLAAAFAGDAAAQSRAGGGVQAPTLQGPPSLQAPGPLQPSPNALPL